MATYINTITKEYPISPSEVASFFPGYVFPPDGIPEEFLEGTNWAPVRATEPPAHTAPDFAKELAPKFTNGEWVQQWEIVDQRTEQAAREAAAAARQAIIDDLRNSRPPMNSVPAIDERLKKIEALLGVLPPDAN